MIPRRSGLALILIALAAGCASTADGTDAQELEGRCYYFERDDAAREMRLPWGVQLMAEPLTGWPALANAGAREAVTLVDEQTTSDIPFAYWHHEAGDTITIGHPGGAGWSLALTVDGQRLVGTATPVGDAGLGPRPGRDVSLIHARCPGQ